MNLSKRVSHIKPAPTLQISAKINELKAKGVDLVGFGAGEPDFDTPDFVKEACIRALKDGKTKYTPSAGILELREALSEKLQRENSVQYSPSEIVVTAGAKMALYLIFMTVLEEGDEVLLPSPYWVTYPEQIMLCGGIPVVVPLKEEKGFVLSVDDIKPHVSKRTKMLVLNSPCNPTGAVVPEEELRKVVEFCIENNILIISDECYEAFLYDGKRFVSPASFSKEAREITFTVNAFSKTYSMTGWRVGYVAAPAKYAKVMADINSQTISNATSFAQYGALEALKNPKAKEFVKEMKWTFERRRNLAYQLLLEIPNISLVKPEGAFYIFPNLSAYLGKLGSDIKLVEYLIEKGRAACVPGSAFGAEGYVRLSYCVSEDTIREGIRRIKQALEELS
ncbi:aminotransferase class I and II [Hydrogenobacter thermophilus TK-6]|uniref:Aminotransferase n=1 Tax=Hydrogenobacter thermophilus (strain DSM 6534 / IAM 12695 / TK-6) TaxID=608538 RepID=D2Z0H8_HYDTT|nr:pyridoxal phosphate-dependent aminotransferase [Hydrogenobacter thermophilus]ADO44419.1 aminotransferase class I and II [Hydrogenobacter thermophilus TK-6]BAI68155.1 aminotransferase [Hydrogenobacter thermophilus TK-6]BAI68475.1 aminotransferase [Hydrogenobacter thermophilus TK-6]